MTTRVTFNENICTQHCRLQEATNAYKSACIPYEISSAYFAVLAVLGLTFAGVYTTAGACGDL